MDLQLLHSLLHSIARMVQVPSPGSAISACIQQGVLLVLMRVLRMEHHALHALIGMQENNELGMNDVWDAAAAPLSALQVVMNSSGASKAGCCWEAGGCGSHAVDVWQGHEGGTEGFLVLKSLMLLSRHPKAQVRVKAYRHVTKGMSLPLTDTISLG